MPDEHRTAAWARDLTDRSFDMSKASDDAWIENALRRIEEAAANGRNYVELLPGHPTDKMYTTLRSLGYDVKVISYQRDREYTRVSW